MSQFPDMPMVRHRLNQIAEALDGKAPPEFLGAEWAVQDALYWMTGDVVYAERADEIMQRKSK